jgi:branched-chain amino acid aminotransferase
MKMYFNEKTIIFFNGNFVKASETNTNLYSQTMHYGNGVFEGIRSYETNEGTRIFKVQEHFERLTYSAKKMHIKMPYTVDELEKISYKLLELNNLKDAYIRPLVFLGDNMSLTPTSEVHIVLMAWEWEKYLGQNSITVMMSSFQRPNPKSCFVDAKVVGHYTNGILATTEAKAKGYDEALLTDMNGNIAEGCASNFFIEKDKKLFTAPLGNILPGITRQTILELAKEMDYEVEEKFFTSKEVFEADSAFFCGTAAEVIGIESVDEYQFPIKWEDSIGAIIQKKYKHTVSFIEYQNEYVS